MNVPAVHEGRVARAHGGKRVSCERQHFARSGKEDSAGHRIRRRTERAQATGAEGAPFTPLYGGDSRGAVARTGCECAERGRRGGVPSLVPHERNLLRWSSGAKASPRLPEPEGLHKVKPQSMEDGEPEQPARWRVLRQSNDR